MSERELSELVEAAKRLGYTSDSLMASAAEQERRALHADAREAVETFTNQAARLRAVAQAMRTEERPNRLARINVDDALADHIGRTIGDVLKLRRDRDDKTRWATTWGNKTNAGLARSVLRMLLEE